MQAQDDIETDAEITLFTEAGMRLLDVVQSGDLRAVKDFVEREDPPMFFQDPDSGWSGLHLAAATEDPEMLEYLLESGGVWNLGQSLSSRLGLRCYQGDHDLTPHVRGQSILWATPLAMCLSRSTTRGLII